MNPPDLDRLLDHSQWLRPMARALVRDEHLAEDALQETYLAAVRRPPTDAPLGAWLAQVLRNAVRMQARKESRRSAREERVARREQGEGPSQNDLLELRLDLVHALLDVREPYRSTLILRFFDDLSPQEIAEAEGVPASTVRVRLKRGLDTLRDRFDRRRDIGLLALLILADLPDLDAAVLWQELEAAERVGASPARPPTVAAGIVTPLIVALVLLLSGVFGSSGDAASNKGSEAQGESEILSPLLRADTSGASSSSELGVVPHAGDAVTETGIDTLPRGARIVDRVPESPRASRVLVTVADPEGAPVAGASVLMGERRLSRTEISSAFPSTQEFLLRDRTPILLGETDARGELIVERSTVATNALTVRAPGFLTHAEGPTLRALLDDRLPVTLLDPIATTLRVRGAGGRTIPTARVRLFDRTGTTSPIDFDPSEPLHLALENREVLVRVEATGFAAVQDFLTAPAHSIELPLGTPFFGRVVDRAGRALAGAEISMRSEAWRGLPALTTTDAAGLFTTISVPRAPDGSLGRIELEVRHSDFVTGRFEISPQGRQLGDLALAPGHELTGTVFDLRGSAQPGAKVTLAPASLAPLEFVDVVTDDQGQFSVSSLPAGEWLVRAQAPQRGFVDQSVTIGSDPEPLELHFSEVDRLDGVVRTPTGDPVAGVPLRVGCVFGDALEGDLVETDADGRFEVALPREALRHRLRRNTLRFAALSESARAAPSREVLLELFLPHQLLEVGGREVEQFAHYGSRNCVAIDLERLAGSGRPLDLVIEPPEPRVPLTFELASESGEPIVAFTNLLISSPEGWTMKDFSGLDGRPLHLPDPWVLDDARVTVMARGFPWTTVRLDLRRSTGRVQFTLATPFEQPPRLHLEGGGALDLLVVPEIDMRDSLIAIPIGATDPRGEITLDTLGPGRYRICTPLVPADLWRTNGKRRTSMPLEETRELGTIDISSHQQQKITLRHRSDQGERNEP